MRSHPPPPTPRAINMVVLIDNPCRLNITVSQQDVGLTLGHGQGAFTDGAWMGTNGRMINTYLSVMFAANVAVASSHRFTRTRPEMDVGLSIELPHDSRFLCHVAHQSWSSEGSATLRKE